MNIKATFVALGVLTLASCSGLPSLLSGNDGGEIDTYFATNVGRQAGHAQAYAALCPSLSFDEAELELYRVAICQGKQLEDDCSLPGLEKEREKTFAETMASLAGVAPEQVCSDAREQAAANPALADYFGIN